MQVERSCFDEVFGNNVGEFQWSQPLSARPRALVEGRQILVFTGNTVQVLTPPEQAASSGQ